MRRANAFSVIFLTVELGLFFGCPISIALGHTVAGFICLGAFMGIILIAIAVVSIASKLNTKDRRDAKFEIERQKHEEEFRLAKARIEAAVARRKELDDRYQDTLARVRASFEKLQKKREAVATLANVLMHVAEKKSAKPAPRYEHMSNRASANTSVGVKKPRRLQ